MPAVAFMLGCNSGSAEDARFREWYRTRYHKPQDDISQPIDFTAAAHVNRFIALLAADVADTESPPVVAPSPAP